VTTSLDHLPLAGIRVVDLADPVGEAAARLLADLGADVLKLEPRGGSATRRQGWIHEGTSLDFAVANANKRSRVADLSTPAGRAVLDEVLREADVVLLGLGEAAVLEPAKLVADNPRLVVVISSPFGSTGPRRDWQATERTLLALSGSLSRSGRPGAPPLVPPAGLATATAAAHIAWLSLVGLVSARASGDGQVIDASHHESLVTGLDPAFGVQGSAAAGRSGKVRRGRPPADSYPVYRCADGQVRLCLLSRRQWRGMFAWLGEPAQFADPRFDSITERVRAADRLNALIEDLFRDQPGAVLVEEAARRGVPLAQVLTLGDVVDTDHYRRAGTIAEVEVAPGMRAVVPVGAIVLDDERLGIRAPLGDPSDEAPDWQGARVPLPGAPAPDDRLPFAGLRVLDLGVIVFGAEAGRAFADLGADVVKVESREFPDGLRQTRGGEPMNASFAWGHRNRRSLGIDLRSAEGVALFLDLAANADVVLANFKPGTLDRLGIGYQALTARNPRIVLLESSAFSSQGPWASRLGYGPLVRAACGVSSLWRYDDSETECWDGVTVYPDHVAARIGAIAVAAALLRRDRTGAGARIELGQSDVALHQLAAQVAIESLEPGAVRPAGNRGHSPVGGLFACAGDDEWCVIDARTTEEVAALRGIVGADCAGWTAVRTPAEVAKTLQDAGVPAAPMVRLPELLDDPQLRQRGTYTTLTHPALDGELPAERVGAPYGVLAEPASHPAPAPGEHTREVCREVLGLDNAAVDDLVDRGVLFEDC
jgi:crotonobetainyl-CoA:carnitine CoA-transferase CaiB-like acyl-CoA transferase